MSIVEERERRAIKRAEKKKALIENIQMLKNKGYSDMLISKFLKIPLSTVRIYTES